MSKISEFGSSILSAASVLGLAVLSSGGVLCLGVEAQAQTSHLKNFAIQQHYVSPRALGMGNAFTAVADDYSTLFYNPAGLARIPEGQINLGIGAMVDSKFLKLIDDIKKTSDSDDISKMVELLENNYGQHYSARVPTLNAFWARPGWGFAVIPVDLSLDLEIHQLAAATLSLMAVQDTTIAYGRGWDLHWLPPGHRLSMGITAKAIYRAYYSKAFLASDLIFDQTLLRPEDADEGMTVDGDIGFLYTPKRNEESWTRMILPTVGMTVRNFVDYGFTSNYHLINAASDEPPKLGRRLDVGTLFELPDWWIFKARAMADIRDIGTEQWTFKKGSHLGAEFLWKVRSWWQGGWRVGVNQGYFTAGFTGLFVMFNLDLVTYAEEVGTSESPQANRRYMVKASMDW